MSKLLSCASQKQGVTGVSENNPPKLDADNNDFTPSSSTTTATYAAMAKSAAIEVPVHHQKLVFASDNGIGKVNSTNTTTNTSPVTFQRRSVPAITKPKFLSIFENLTKPKASLPKNTSRA